MRNLEGKSQLVVMSIGGGPATDMFAIIAAAEFIQPNHNGYWDFHIFDRAADGWLNVVRDLVATHIPLPRSCCTFHNLNFPSNDDLAELVPIGSI